MSKQSLEIIVNGENYVLAVEPNCTLMELLRDDLELTGAKEGCGEGVCGSCTVLMDGKPIRSCLTLALEASGSHITTVEGLAQHGDLDPLQQSFIDHGAVQCGFCTSGMLMSAKGLLLENPHAGKKEIRNALSGHICRCTGYTKIVEAVESVVDRSQEKR
ncbi:MAG: (2Fe-2S)-binding protein [Deltaproteobacteria bacterium]|nr:(2Fe-2S)-binding protein [Deltaproteobacteria bacterium]